MRHFLSTQRQTNAPAIRARMGQLAPTSWLLTSATVWKAGMELIARLVSEGLQHTWFQRSNILLAYCFDIDLPYVSCLSLGFMFHLNLHFGDFLYLLS